MDALGESEESMVNWYCSPSFEFVVCLGLNKKDFFCLTDNQRHSFNRTLRTRLSDESLGFFLATKLYSLYSGKTVIVLF